MPRRPRESLQKAREQQQLDVRGERARQGEDGEDGDADHQGEPSAPSVAEGSGDELTEPEPDHARRHRGLSECLRGAERGGELRQLRQIQVHRQRAERLEHAEHEHRVHRAHPRPRGLPGNGSAHPSRCSVRRSQLARAASAACETSASGEKPEKPW